MRADITLEKGETILFIGTLRTEDTSWEETSVKPNIGRIGQFLKNNNRGERMKLASSGAIRLTMEEAKE
eukprot:6861873-Heterocapsa_arctica.AAC.1